MANHIAEVAKMLGVELGEIFKIQIDENKTFQFRFTESGFQCFNGKMWNEDVVAMACLNLLLVGKYAIKRKPWKPNLDDEYYYADLVFYNRILHCNVIVELKDDEFKHKMLIYFLYRLSVKFHINYVKL